MHKSAVDVQEVLCVAGGRYGQIGDERAWEFLSAAEIEIAPFDELQVRAAAAAFDRYGKGVNARSALDLADCAAYALSLPLLFKGNDFVNTDVDRA